MKNFVYKPETLIEDLRSYIDAQDVKLEIKVIRTEGRRTDITYGHIDKKLGHQWLCYRTIFGVETIRTKYIQNVIETDHGTLKCKLNSTLVGDKEIEISLVKYGTDIPFEL